MQHVNRWQHNLLQFKQVLCDMYIVRITMAMMMMNFRYAAQPSSELGICYPPRFSIDITGLHLVIFQ